MFFNRSARDYAREFFKFSECIADKNILYVRIAFCVFINYNMEIFKDLGEYKLSI